MGLLSYMWSIVEPNVVMRHMTVYSLIHCFEKLCLKQKLKCYFQTPGYKREGEVFLKWALQTLSRPGGSG